VAGGCVGAIGTMLPSGAIAGIARLSGSGMATFGVVAA